MKPLTHLNPSDVVVVVPVYKERPGVNEQNAFVQCLRILRRYDVVVIHPCGLDLSAYRELGGAAFRPVAFPGRFFRSTAGYNRLLMRPAFYRAFAQYRYMLLCQLDAWVFSDELLEWCRKGYDYIGAPWLAEPERQWTSALIPFTKLCLNRVGNGGFSLRNVDTHLRLAERLRPLTFLYFYNEDVFWSLIVPLFFRTYRKPSVQEALGFAFESMPGESYRRIGSRLPFGCHAWEKNEPEFWRQFIYPAVGEDGLRKDAGEISECGTI